EGSRDADPLLHASAELAGEGVLDAGQADGVDELPAIFRRSSGGVPLASRPSSTFFSTVNQGNRAKDWKTIATCGLSARIGSPSKKTSPEVGFSRPTMIRSNVDLPLPEGPTTQTKSRSVRSNRTRSRTLNSFAFSKNDLATSLTCNSGRS